MTVRDKAQVVKGWEDDPLADWLHGGAVRCTARKANGEQCANHAQSPRRPDGTDQHCYNHGGR